jgi:hypothetical protein
MCQWHQVSIWPRTTVPHPLCRCVCQDLVPSATNAAPAGGVTVSRAGREGMMLAQHARSAPVRTHPRGAEPCLTELFRRIAMRNV